MRFLSKALAYLLAMMGAAGCGPDEQTTTAASSSGGVTDAGDGRYRPPTNGEHTTETGACDALLAAQDAKIKSLMCSITTRTCPALLRVDFSVACMEYDQGSVQGCVEYYKAKTTCDGVEDAIKECLVTAYPGTEPGGCPTSP